jgi:putative transposase
MKGECGQRRYWEHGVRDERDNQNHLDYIHYNPVKHGHVQKVKDWQYSSFHQWVRRGKNSENWTTSSDIADFPME